MLQKIFPFLTWLPGVNKQTLYADLQAGLTGAVIVLPQGVAFAMIAGLPPEYGLYTAMITPIIAALFGSSWHLISGPTTAISIVVFAALNSFAEPGSTEFVRLALVLTFLAGVFQLILGLARMGTLVNFVSHSVIIAFTAGAALLIATSQMKHILGLDIPQGLSFFQSWREIVIQTPNTNLYVLGVALMTLGSAILIKRLVPKWPYMLFAMVIGSIGCWLLNAADHGVALVGELPAHLPPFRIPDLSEETIIQLVPDAFAIALLGLIEAVAIARAIATHTHQRIDGNQEFIGQGLSNLIGSFFSSYAGSGSFTRSGVNHQSGAKTPLAAIFAAIILALILLFIASWTAYLPIPAMGGIILLVAYNLIDFHHIKLILSVSKTETAVLVVTFLSTLFLELEFAIYIGVLFSLIFYLQQTSKPNIEEKIPEPKAPTRSLVNVKFSKASKCPQLKLLNIEGSLFFGSVNHVAEALHKIDHEKEKHILILADELSFIDMAGAEFLAQEAKRLKALDGGLYITGLKQAVIDLFKKGGYWEEIGESHIFSSKREAIHLIYQYLNKEICQTCNVRIFEECGKNAANY